MKKNKIIIIFIIVFIIIGGFNFINKEKKSPSDEHNKIFQDVTDIFTITYKDRISREVYINWKFILQEKVTSEQYVDIPAIIDNEWIGKYSFDEFAEPNQTRTFYIEVYENDKNELEATINIDGFQMMKRILAKVDLEDDQISFILKGYLPDNIIESFEHGSLLLRIKKSDNGLETYWGEIQPMLITYPESKIDYFKRISK